MPSDAARCLKLRPRTWGAGRTSLERFLVNSATPLVCRMADGRLLSFFFFIFCLSFFLSLSSCSLATNKKQTPATSLVHCHDVEPRVSLSVSVALTCGVLHPSAAVWAVWSLAPGGRTAPCWCRRNPSSQNHIQQLINVAWQQPRTRLLCFIRKADKIWRQTAEGGYRGGFLLKGDFSVVVDSSLLLPLLVDVDSCCSQLSALLQGSQPSAAQSDGHLCLTICVCMQLWKLFHLKKWALTTQHVWIMCVSNLASSSCFSLAFLLAFLPWVLASRALASDSISSSSVQSETGTFKSLV